MQRAPSCAGATAVPRDSPVDRWSTLLQPHRFPAVTTQDGASILELVTPYRAEDAAVMPLRVKALTRKHPRVSSERRTCSSIRIRNHWQDASSSRQSCSAPIATDYEQALTTLGQMNLRTLTNPDSDDLVAQLRIRHPDPTGMQKVHAY